MRYSNALLPDYLKEILKNRDYKNGYFLFHRVLHDGKLDVEQKRALSRIDDSKDDDEKKDKKKQKIVDEAARRLLKNTYFRDDISRVINSFYEREIKKLVTEKAEAYREQFNGRYFELVMETVTPLILGIGEKTVSETSLTMHPIYGIPYIPGQAIKGMLRSYYVREFFETDEAKALKSPVFRFIFGSGGDDTGNKGRICFLDAFPSGDSVELGVEIANNHYRSYYTEGESISDSENPNPVKFFSVSKAVMTFQVVLPVAIPEKVKKDAMFSNLYGDAQEAKQVQKHLKDALTYCGIGAKTSIGYGRFK